MREEPERTTEFLKTLCARESNRRAQCPACCCSECGRRGGCFLWSGALARGPYARAASRLPPPLRRQQQSLPALRDRLPRARHRSVITHWYEYDLHFTVFSMYEYSHLHTLYILVPVRTFLWFLIGFVECGDCARRDTCRVGCRPHASRHRRRAGQHADWALMQVAWTRFQARQLGVSLLSWAIVRVSTTVRTLYLYNYNSSLPTKYLYSFGPKWRWSCSTRWRIPMYDWLTCSRVHRNALQSLVFGLFYTPQLKFDEERVLLALHAAHFVPGLLLLHERAKRYQDILRYFLESGSPVDVIDTCTRFGCASHQSPVLCFSRPRLRLGDYVADCTNAARVFLLLDMMPLRRYEYISDVQHGAAEPVDGGARPLCEARAVYPRRQAIARPRAHSCALSFACPAITRLLLGEHAYTIKYFVLVLNLF